MGKGTRNSNFKKPRLTPARQMKALWWTRLNFGRQLKSESVWDMVDDVIDDLPLEIVEERFAKVLVGAANPSTETPRQEKPNDQSKAPRTLQIIHDPNVRAGKEAAIRGFPSVVETVDALFELDPFVLTTHRLNVLKEHLCPSPAQIAQLEEARKENPNVPFASPEEYMWHISQVPAFRDRVNCWMFIRDYEERVSTYAAGLADFQQIQDAILKSKSLPRLLSLILALGNYLNGGNSQRGQADGFDLETIGKLDSIKDNVHAAKDMRHFIFEILFLGQVGVTERGLPTLANDGVLLVEELRPLLSSIRRTLVRGAQNTLTLAKSARVCLEDLEESIRDLVDDYVSQQSSLQTCLQSTRDPSDPMKLYMADQIAQAQVSLEQLQEQARKARAGYIQMLSFFNHPGLKTSDFLLLWDNLFIPSDLILNRPEAFRKQHLFPRFCQPLSKPQLEDLLLLWDFCTPEQVARLKPRVPSRRQTQKRKTCLSMTFPPEHFADRWKRRGARKSDQRKRAE